jgi:hypothetical protein
VPDHLTERPRDWFSYEVANWKHGSINKVPDHLTERPRDWFSYEVANWKHGHFKIAGERRRGLIEKGWGATAGVDRKMNNEPLEREPLDRVRARSEA